MFKKTIWFGLLFLSLGIQDGTLTATQSGSATVVSDADKSEDDHVSFSSVFFPCLGIFAVGALAFYACEKSFDSSHKLSSLVVRQNFFHDILGVDEVTFRNWNRDQHAQALVPVFMNGRVVYHLRHRNGTLYQAGYFEELSIERLRLLTQGINRGGGTFSVVDGVRLAGGQPQLRVDIGGLQADAANNDAVFQVASNFNALETVNAHQNIGNQLLHEYVNDLTQGPAASISAAPGLILRHYYMYHQQLQQGEPNTWRQSPERQVNLLSELPHLPVTRAGYVQLDQVVNMNRMPNNDDLSAIKVGFHGDVQVSHGYMQDQHLHAFNNHRVQIISQVFTAAVDFGATNRHLLGNPIAEQWARFIIYAAYEGAIRATVAKGKRRVVLTLVGGGVFGNNLAWIAEALERMQQFVVDAGLEVILIGYNRLPDFFQQRMRALVVATGGSYEQ